MKYSIEITPRFEKEFKKLDRYTQRMIKAWIDKNLVGCEDIKGALDAGMHAIRMNWGWFKGQDLRKDVPVITDILDVLKYV